MPGVPRHRPATAALLEDGRMLGPISNRFNGRTGSKIQPGTAQQGTRRYEISTCDGVETTNTTVATRGVQSSEEILMQYRCNDVDAINDRQKKVNIQNLYLHKAL